VEYISLILSLITVALVSFIIFINFRNKDGSNLDIVKNELTDKFSTSLEKLSNISSNIDSIKEATSSMSIPITNMNKYLGGNVQTGRLGEWNLESIVKDIMPNNKYYFQYPIDPNTQNQVDCAIETTNEILIPIDSKFYAAQYSDYQEATTKTDRDRILNSLKNSIVKDAESISEKYFVDGITSKIGVLYIPSEGLVAMVNLIEGLRESLLRDQSILILGPNSLAGFLDSIRMGHEAVELNEKAELVAKVIGDIKEEFNNLNLSTIDLKKAVDGVSKKIDVYQTRINVLNKELNKGAEKLEESEIEN
jgi:DNA recombination protein RmuC